MILILVIVLVLVYLGTRPPKPLDASPHIIVDKARNRLYYFNQGQLLHEFPVATGSSANLTPEGSFVIAEKVVIGEEDSIFGSHWLGLALPDGTDTQYGIHGTNEPSTIGTFASKGCVRMYNHHVEFLYNLVDVGTAVEIYRGPFYTVRLWLARRKGSEGGATIAPLYPLLSQ
ncbi:MAG TPA: L,D-transpeptidase [Firmicutes bacterium]|nr:L,D-transpeptidase [Bacillota bacterium]